jgi:hypothetical protein
LKVLFALFKFVAHPSTGAKEAAIVKELD